MCAPSKILVVIFAQLVIFTLTHASNNSHPTFSATSIADCASTSCPGLEHYTSCSEHWFRALKTCHEPPCNVGFVHDLADGCRDTPFSQDPLAHGTLSRRQVSSYMNPTTTSSLSIYSEGIPTIGQLTTLPPIVALPTSAGVWEWGTNEAWPSVTAGVSEIYSCLQGYISNSDTLCSAIESAALTGQGIYVVGQNAVAGAMSTTADSVRGSINTPYYISPTSSVFFEPSTSTISNTTTTETSTAIFTASSSSPPSLTAATSTTTRDSSIAGPLLIDTTSPTIVPGMGTTSPIAPKVTSNSAPSTTSDSVTTSTTAHITTPSTTQSGGTRVISRQFDMLWFEAMVIYSTWSFRILL
ncbi:MAG: hypothetical protein M1827_000324 [Pycnora praestabilis]|nr:MAG: hypothetical protein M1827_000324 [Pycnora praestabilis]